MEIISQPCAATIGIFDGVHAGHQFLIQELKKIARERKLQSIVITFAEHPRKIISKSFTPELLTTRSEKIAKIESLGIDKCIVIHFTQEMAKLSAFDFIKTILFEQYNVRTLLVGHDHRFGHNRADGFTEYQQFGNLLGMEVIQASRYTSSKNENISSSNIRLALQAGEIEQANTLLTYPYSICGTVVEGFKNGRKFGFPTANIEPNNPEKLIPQNGVYHVKVCWNNSFYTGMLNVGSRPTISNNHKISIEVHILNFNEDIYNQNIEISFIAKIRNEKKFNDVNELIAQLQKDKEWILNLNNMNK